jgi:hypothetical protein
LFDSDAFSSFPWQLSPRFTLTALAKLIFVMATLLLTMLLIKPLTLWLLPP